MIVKKKEFSSIHTLERRSIIINILFTHFFLLFIQIIEHVSQTTLSTILTVKHISHKDTSSTLFIRTFSSQSVNFAIVIHIIVFQLCQMDLLMFVLNLFRGCIILLLTLLGPTTQTKYQMKSRFFLDVIITQCTTILQLFASKN